MVKENFKNSIRQGGVTKAMDTFQGLLKNKDQKAAASHRLMPSKLCPTYRRETR